MAAKKSIWLIDYRKVRHFNKRDEDFRIMKLKNSTLYSPGTYLSESEVNDLIRSGWDVTIKERNTGGIP